MNDVQRIQKGLQYLGYDAASVVFEKADCFYTETENGRKKVYYKELCDCYRGLYFSQEKTRKQSFERLGYLLDCSRGAVVKVEKVKEWIATLACFGYNRLLLYTEASRSVCTVSAALTPEARALRLLARYTAQTATSSLQRSTHFLHPRTN